MADVYPEYIACPNCGKLFGEVKDLNTCVMCKTTTPRANLAPVATVTPTSAPKREPDDEDEQPFVVGGG